MHTFSSTHSNDSSQTQSTAPTTYSEHRPIVKHYDTCPAEVSCFVEEPLDYRDDIYPSSSVDTYASTLPSVEDISDRLQREPPSEDPRKYASDAIPSTPPDFAELFPSTRRLLIRHDESTSDSNMNLRVDVELATSSGFKFKMTLFHLRMRDLRERHFSLRRYCRESGREVCNSKKKYTRPSVSRPKRPTVQRSLTSALQNLGAKAVPHSFRRHDSGYESDGADDWQQFTSSDLKATIPTDTIKLEFSNYAQVEVHRLKAKSDKRYEFEYWGTPYYWSREPRQEAHGPSVSYTLVNANTGKRTARIAPQVLSRKEARAEEFRGGWVPPCTMVISDQSIPAEKKTDLADVIVATGLVALVDDSIKHYWHSRDSVQSRSHLSRQKNMDHARPNTTH